MERLTKAEESIMQILWEIKRGVVWDIIDKLPSPRPAYSSVSTIVRILEKKGFVDHKAYGKTYEYFPKITKRAYKSYLFKQIKSNYFDNSIENLVSFMVREEKLSPDDIKEILRLIENEGEDRNNGSDDQ